MSGLFMARLGTKLHPDDVATVRHIGPPALQNASAHRSAEVRFFVHVTRGNAFNQILQTIDAAQAWP